MKVFLIYNIEENTAAARIQSLLNGMGLLVEIFPAKVMSGETEAALKAIGAILGFSDSDGREYTQTNAASHILIAAPLPERWLDFLAGVSFGSRRPFLFYGEKAITAIPKEFAFCFTSLATEAALTEYFAAESEAFKKREAARAAFLAREELLRGGIPVSEESLAYCVNESGVETVSLFFAAGYSPNTRDKAGVPLLNLAARKGNGEMLRLLLRAGADVDLRAVDRGTSALVDSAMGKYRGLAADLLEAGADVDSKSKDGQSALVVAVGAGDEGMTELLLKAGANPDIPDNLGASARKYAALFHQKNIMTLFETYAPAAAV